MLDRTGDTSFFGSIKDEHGCICYASFPGKYESGWDSLIDSRHTHSVACVFLCTAKDGIGKHYSEDGAFGQCMCHTIYGERDFETFGYLKVLSSECSIQEERLERQKAEATKTVVIRADASEADMEKARAKAKQNWKDNGKAASWGCLWFKLWKEQIERAVEKKQRLKVVFFAGQTDAAIFLWEQLKTADLWNNKGCGASQKGEIAYLEKMKEEKGKDYEYDRVDVAHFLKEKFIVGAKVDAFDGQMWWKGTLLKPSDQKDTPWVVKLEAGDLIVTDRVRQANLISELLAEVGKDEFCQFVTGALRKGLEVEHSQEFAFPDGTPALAIKLGIQSIHVLQHVRDMVLNSDLEAIVNTELLKRNKSNKWQVRVDKTRFCMLFEQKLLRFKDRTQHQTSKLKNIEELLQKSPVMVSAPAGCGKTFVAVQCACDVITGTTGRILFVAPSAALGLYFVRWLAQGCAEHLPLHDLLKRVVLMKPPYETFLSLGIDGRGHLRFKPMKYYSMMQFVLVVVDEAHDVCQSNEYSKFFDEKVKTQRHLLLSSQSQASVPKFALPDVNEVKLTQVVRSSQRIVAGSAAFQGSAEEKLDVDSLCPAGPPLKTFFFKPSQDVDYDYVQYARRTFAAVSDIMQTYAGLSLHRRLALLVPNQDFLDKFRIHFLPYLSFRLSGRRIQATSFEDSLSVLPDFEVKSSAEVIVMDTVANAKGLEKLIVVCIGLDQKLSDQSINLETRALIYQAITRAQLQAIVVNHHIQGGWLEFIGLLNFEEKAYDASSAMAETTTQAASQSISGESVESPPRGAAPQKPNDINEAMEELDVKISKDWMGR